MTILGSDKVPEAVNLLFNTIGKLNCDFGGCKMRKE